MNPRYKLLIGLLLFLSARCMAQCPPNIGFEDGTFGKWECYSGSIDANGGINVSLSNYIGSNQAIFKKGDNGVDMYGDFPLVCPNGSGYSIKLGNESTGRGAERISYTYTVPPGQTMTLVLNYAVVLGDPINHAGFEQPRFTAKVFNVTDNVPIDCPAFDFIASSGPGFKLSPIQSPIPSNANGAPAGNTNSNDRNVQYREWSATTINLEGYGGKTIRLEFTTNDCSKGGHFGYAYLDIDETCDRAITGNNYCVGQSNVTLRGPGGFADYKWYLGSAAVGPVIGSKQSVTLPVPPDGTEYTLAIEPYLGLGCSSTLHTTVNQLPTPFVLKVNNPPTGCNGYGINLTDAAVTMGSSPDIDLSYHTDPVTLAYLYNPENITTPGTYYIKGTLRGGGCTDIQPVEVKFNNAPTMDAISPKTAAYPGTVDLTMQVNPGMTYNYYKDAAGTISLDNYTAITASGTFYIRGTSTATGCQTSLQAVKVTITPPPPFVLSIPNAFTPNNDGVNDLLDVSIKGYLSFGNIKVFNRYGALLYTTNLQSQSWPGTLHGKPLPVGTYYWIFEGTDTYYKTPVRKSGSVAILR